MSDTTEIHPLEKLKQASQHLSESSTFAARHADTVSTRADAVETAVEDINIKDIFRQLHQLVAMVDGGQVDDKQPQHDSAPDLVEAAPTKALQAAE